MKSKQIQLNRTGIYLRLSKDDERAGESISIENQRLMLTKYVEEKPEGLENVSNGDTVTVKYTGTVSEVDPFEGEVISVEKTK